MGRQDHGASPADAADRVTDAPHEAASASSPSGSVPTGAVGFGGRTFRSEGGKLIANPLERRKPDGRTGIALGFPFCELHEVVAGEDVAAELAEYLSCPKRAAAPELFEALDEFEHCFSRLDLSDSASQEAMRLAGIKARAALAKARAAMEVHHG